jgi:hypothetical protein
MLGDSEQLMILAWLPGNLPTNDMDHEDPKNHMRADHLIVGMYRILNMNQPLAAWSTKRTSKPTDLVFMTQSKGQILVDAHRLDLGGWHCDDSGGYLMAGVTEKTKVCNLPGPGVGNIAAQTRPVS